MNGEPARIVGVAAGLQSSREHATEEVNQDVMVTYPACFIGDDAVEHTQQVRGLYR